MDAEAAQWEGLLAVAEKLDHPDHHPRVPTSADAANHARVLVSTPGFLPRVGRCFWVNENRARVLLQSGSAFTCNRDECQVLPEKTS